MIYQKQSRFSPDELDQPLREAAQRHKFGILNMLDMKVTLKNKGIDFAPEARVYDICNPQAASDALNQNLAVATLLPCRIAVYSSPGGSTIAMLNPTDLFASSGLQMNSTLPADVQRELMAIIDEAAG